MMSGVSNKEKKLFIKTYYYPIEIAIRWGELFEYEACIISHYESSGIDDSFSSCWPDVTLNLERVFDGIVNDDLLYGKNGINDTHVQKDDPELSIRHVDLKNWIIKF